MSRAPVSMPRRDRRDLYHIGRRDYRRQGKPIPAWCQTSLCQPNPRSLG